MIEVFRFLRYCKTKVGSIWTAMVVQILHNLLVQLCDGNNTLKQDMAILQLARLHLMFSPMS
ncbi:hypothetical protein DSL64_27275 [Dyadobacter luteus]|uniref:Uncharacterized protein n=1 Tax=Dyadobacter luteus TaxID=2259619 RepID=A0A3D8Y3X3_9BACT|nr:hypothetical protein DSL64_27275 [Dyadobacter luteus]